MTETPEQALRRHDEAVRLMFHGLHMHFLEAACSGRIAEWREVGHATIDLLSSLDPAVLALYGKPANETPKQGGGSEGSSDA